MSDRKKLEKLVITSFANRDFSGEDKSRKFSTPINPESFTKNYKVSVAAEQGHGSPGAEVKYKSTVPEELKIEFVLDGTKTMEGYGGENKDYINKPVEQQLKDFLNCAYNMDGLIHRPRFLIVFWGSEINFRCVLSNVDINYTLFEPDGKPLRVKISATFLKHKTRKELIEEEKLSSPDLTHYRRAKQGDRLDLMTYNIYNESKYFLQVGLANVLTSIRHLKPGIELYFPPFDKNEV
ncbi:MAG: LysM peptidoglycan-binding domain-containing protein [Ferruginibacter sp.]